MRTGRFKLFTEDIQLIQSSYHWSEKLLDARRRGFVCNRSSRLFSRREKAIGQVVGSIICHLVLTIHPRSTSWTCPTCGVPNSELLGQVEPITAHSKTISDVDDSLSSKGNGDSSGQSLTPRVSESHSESSDPIRSPSENTTPRPPDPPPTRTSQSPAHDEISPRPVPRWLDVTLIIFISLLVVLVAHRLS